MSDSTPTIIITRGKRPGRGKENEGQSAGSGCPGGQEVVSGLAHGARTLWWAGLGVLTVAEEGSATVVNALLEEGKSWVQAPCERSERTAKRVDALAEEGTQVVEAVEEHVHDGVSETLHRIGLPHRGDVDELRDRIDVLDERLDQLADEISERQE